MEGTEGGGGTVARSSGGGGGDEVSKIPFDRISRHFRSIRNFYFFYLGGGESEMVFVSLMSSHSQIPISLPI